MDYSEKRDFHRMAMDCRFEYETLDGSERFEGTAKNLSTVGILFETAVPTSAGVEMKLTLTPQHSITPPMQAIFTVIRCDELAQGSYQVAGEITSIL